MDSLDLDINNAITAEEANKETLLYTKLQRETDEIKLTTELLNLIFLFIKYEISNGSNTLDFDFKAETVINEKKYAIINNDKCVPLIMKYLDEQGYKVSVENTGYEEESVYLHIKWGE